MIIRNNGYPLDFLSDTSKTVFEKMTDYGFAPTEKARENSLRLLKDDAFWNS